MYLSSAAAAGAAGAGFCCASAGAATMRATARAANVFIILGSPKSLSLEQGIAAIDDEVAPRRVAGGIARQIDCNRPEIGADAPAPLRDARLYVAGELLVAEGVGRHLGLDPAGQDRVRGDVVARELDRQRPHHGAYPALARAVVARASR